MSSKYHWGIAYSPYTVSVKTVSILNLFNGELCGRLLFIECERWGNSPQSPIFQASGLLRSLEILVPGKLFSGILCPEKKSNSTGFELENLGPKGKHVVARPLRHSPYTVCEKALSIVHLLMENYRGLFLLEGESWENFAQNPISQVWGFISNLKISLLGNLFSEILCPEKI